MNENNEQRSSGRPMECPNCASTDVVKASVAYQMGTSTGSYGTVAIGAADGQLGIGRTGGRSTSEFAQGLKPPSSAPSELGCAVFAGFAVIFGIGWLFDPPSHDALWAALMIGPAVAVGYFTYKAMAPDQQAERRAKLDKYEQLWVCLRCGQTADKGAFAKRA